MAKQLITALILIALGGLLWLKYGGRHLERALYSWKNGPPAGLSRTFEKQGPIYAAVSARGEGPDAKLALLQRIDEDSYIELHDLTTGELLAKDQWTRSTILKEIKFLDTAQGEALVIVSYSSDYDELTIRLVDTGALKTRWIKNISMMSEHGYLQKIQLSTLSSLQHHDDMLMFTYPGHESLTAIAFSLKDGASLWTERDVGHQFVMNSKNRRYERLDENRFLCWLEPKTRGVGTVCEEDPSPLPPPIIEAIQGAQVTIKGEREAFSLPALPPLAMYQPLPEGQVGHITQDWIFPLQYPGRRAGELIAVGPFTREVRWRAPTSAGAKQWKVVGERIVGWTQEAQHKRYRVDVHQRADGALLGSYELSLGWWSCPHLEVKTVSDSVFALDACGAHWVISDRILNAVEGGGAKLTPLTP